MVWWRAEEVLVASARVFSLMQSLYESEVCRQCNEHPPKPSEAPGWLPGLLFRCTSAEAGRPLPCGLATVTNAFSWAWAYAEGVVWGVAAGSHRGGAVNMLRRLCLRPHAGAGDCEAAAGCRVMSLETGYCTWCIVTFAECEASVNICTGSGAGFIQ